jgi:hypothetical protein
MVKRRKLRSLSPHPHSHRYGGTLIFIPTYMYCHLLRHTLTLTHRNLTREGIKICDFYLQKHAEKKLF